MGFEYCQLGQKSKIQNNSKKNVGMFTVKYPPSQKTHLTILIVICVKKLTMEELLS
jgi:hypothetical protein